MFQFPKNFLWGAATSAYQVEGNNNNSDWWAWEKEAGKESSGEACRHYQLYEQDFDLAKSLHHNAHRLSIEWGRIEPEEGRFSQKELEHYANVVRCLRARHIEPVVTLHHFTNPIWFGRSGGWENRRSVAQFLRYCEKVVRILGPHVHYWVTINEPTVYISHAYLFGAWPPQKKSLLKVAAVEDHMVRAHILAYRLIHKIYQELSLSSPAVGFSQYTQAFVPCGTGLVNRFAAYLRNKWFNFGIIDKIMRRRAIDFIGINYYSRQLVEVTSLWIGNMLMDVCHKNHCPVAKNSLGWDIYPEGLYGMLLKVKKYGLPVIITENGICTSDDGQRWEYIAAHLKNIHRAITEGVPVAGYLYWSLLDNFEWDKGFGPRFGLIDIDYRTSQRTIRESARKFGQVCQAGVLE
jgi:beta-glucosidase